MSTGSGLLHYITETRLLRTEDKSSSSKGSGSSSGASAQRCRSLQSSMQRWMSKLRICIKSHVAALLMAYYVELNFSQLSEPSLPPACPTFCRCPPEKKTENTGKPHEHLVFKFISACSLPAEVPTEHKIPSNSSESEAFSRPSNEAS